MSDRIIHRLHRCQETFSYTPMLDMSRALIDVIAASLLWMNYVLRMTSFYGYEWSCKFMRFYKKKERNENISFLNFCLKIIDMIYARKK
jgi:hypothetical protein